MLLLFIIVQLMCLIHTSLGVVSETPTPTLIPIPQSPTSVSPPPKRLIFNNVIANDPNKKYPPNLYTEQIFLPVPLHNYHPDKTHENLSVHLNRNNNENNNNQNNYEKGPFNLFDFSSYIFPPVNKPYISDYGLERESKLNIDTSNFFNKTKPVVSVPNEQEHHTSNSNIYNKFNPYKVPFNYFYDEYKRKNYKEEDKVPMKNIEYVDDAEEFDDINEEEGEDDETEEDRNKDGKQHSNLQAKEESTTLTPILFYNRPKDQSRPELKQDQQKTKHHLVSPKEEEHTTFAPIIFYNRPKNIYPTRFLNENQNQNYSDSHLEEQYTTLTPVTVYNKPKYIYQSQLTDQHQKQNYSQSQSEEEHTTFVPVAIYNEPKYIYQQQKSDQEKNENYSDSHLKEEVTTIAPVTAYKKPKYIYKPRLPDQNDNENYSDYGSEEQYTTLTPVKVYNKPKYIYQPQLRNGNLEENYSDSDLRNEHTTFFPADTNKPKYIYQTVLPEFKENDDQTDYYYDSQKEKEYTTFAPIVVYNKPKHIYQPRLPEFKQENLKRPTNIVQEQLRKQKEYRSPNSPHQKTTSTSTTSTTTQEPETTFKNLPHLPYTPKPNAESVQNDKYLPIGLDYFDLINSKTKTNTVLNNSPKQLNDGQNFNPTTESEFKIITLSATTQSPFKINADIPKNFVEGSDEEDEEDNPESIESTNSNNLQKLIELYNPTTEKYYNFNKFSKPLHQIQYEQIPVPLKQNQFHQDLYQRNLYFTAIPPVTHQPYVEQYSDKLLNKPKPIAESFKLNHDVIPRPFSKHPDIHKADFKYYTTYKTKRNSDTRPLNKKKPKFIKNIDGSIYSSKYSNSYDDLGVKPRNHNSEIEIGDSLPITEHYQPSAANDVQKVYGEAENIVTSKPSTEKPNPEGRKILDEIKYFQDIFSAQLTPHNLEFGHISENPDGWEERYEKKDMKKERHQGKVRWGDKKGGYGEHYWDLNHHNSDDSDTKNPS